MIERLYSAVKRRRRGLAITSESGTGRRGPGAEDEVLVLFLLIKVRFLSPPYSNCPGSTCLTHLGTEGIADANSPACKEFLAAPTSLAVFSREQRMGTGLRAGSRLLRTNPRGEAALKICRRTR